MRLTLSIISAHLFLFPLGCSTIQVHGTTVKKLHAHFGVTMLPSSWQKKSFRGADLFFEHIGRDADIYVSSQCENFSDSPLDAMTAQMLVGMGKYEIISQKTLALADREALISEVAVKIDGVPRYLKIMVLRKNRCAFDAVFSARIDRKSLVKDFDDMVASFWAEADL
jgi:hypothetical protein